MAIWKKQECCWTKPQWEMVQVHLKVGNIAKQEIMGDGGDSCVMERNVSVVTVNMYCRF